MQASRYCQAISLYRCFREISILHHVPCNLATKGCCRSIKIFKRVQVKRPNCVLRWVCLILSVKTFWRAVVSSECAFWMIYAYAYGPHPNHVTRCLHYYRNSPWGNLFDGFSITCDGISIFSRWTLSRCCSCPLHIARVLSALRQGTTNRILVCALVNDEWLGW